MNAERAIVVALLVSAGVLTLRGMQSGTLTPRTYAALIVVAFLLLALGSFLPELAAALAILVMVAVLLSGSADLAKLGELAMKGRSRTRG